MALHVWEPIDSATRRLPVPGGWIYDVGVDEYAVTFVPEPAANRIANDETAAEVIAAAGAVYEWLTSKFPNVLGQPEVKLDGPLGDLRAALAKLDSTA